MSKNESLHPSVQQFKEFVRSHPLLVKEVRNGNKTWQDFFEEWSILGGNHENWEPYKRVVKEEPIKNEESSTEINNETKSDANEETTGQSSEALSHLVGLIKNINFQDIQHHLSQFNGVLSNVQQLMGNFQGGQNNNQQQQQQQQQQEQQQPHDPFSFRGF